MADEYVRQESGNGSELEEPRRTTEEVYLGDEQSPSVSEGGAAEAVVPGGFGGVSESEAPHHILHTSDDPLPKPSGNEYEDQTETFEDASDDNSDFGGPKPEDTTTETTDAFGSDPTPNPTQFGLEGKTKAGEPGTGPEINGDYDTASKAYASNPESETPELPNGAEQEDLQAPTKKESFLTKLKEKLPGHHKSADAETTPVEQETVESPPKKNMVEKIKEKLPGKHASS